MRTIKMPMKKSWSLLAMFYTASVVFSMDFAEDLDENIKKYVSEHGVSRIELALKKAMEEWKGIPLNIAVTGNSGTGKSSFINAIRDLTGDDEGAAKIGVIETTDEPSSYAHPNNPSLKFWDLPGFGTLNFPKDSYLEKVEFWKYDCFLIFVSERFRESDAWLINEMTTKKKKFYFVRAKIDMDIENDKFSHPNTSNSERVLSEVRKNCRENLQRVGIENADIFILSNRYPDKWDFPKLSARIIEDLPIRKREGMIYSLRALTSDSVRQKRKTLDSRIWKAAALSGINALVPVPGLSVAADVGLIVYEANFYMKVFGLDEASLKSLASATGVKVDSLFSAAALPTLLNFCSKKGIVALLASYGPMVAAEEYLRYVPFVGSAVAGGLSFTVTMKALTDILDTMEETAMKVVKVTVDKTVQNQSLYTKTEL